ncbi:zinc finger C2HC domain-containing protein 1A-like [Liolophura sinensis]|uniref:zinc finger C2HC domain-containing protein 1A-like n=1 Tax=Liolophura sinensis TaxID=3198878 RepID=UPI0031585C27
MVRHEIVCKDVNGKANGTTRMNKPPYVAKPTGDWRTTHENLVKNIRNLRRSSSRSRIEDEDEEEDIQMPPESNYIKCHICGRTFNKPAMERHTIYCQMRYQANCGEPDENMFFSRESYPKTMPNSYSSSSGIPPSGRSSQQSHPGSESPRMSRSTAPGKYSSKTCFPDLRTRRTMDEPFVFTSTGLHSHRSTSRNPSPSPRMYEFHFASKGSDNFGLSGKRMPFTEDRGHLTRNQCPNCCSVYAKNARYCISCGFKRSG